MRVNRRFLYAGVFLLAIGGVLVTTDTGLFDAAGLADVVRLWPAVLVAFGAALVLRRTQFSLPSGLLAAALPGLLIGSGIAIVPRFAGDCGGHANPIPVTAQDGSFDGPASVSVTSGCGTLTVSTSSGSGWHFQAANSASRAPIVESSPASLSIDSIARGGWDVFDAG